MRINALVVAPYAGLAELTNSLKTELKEFNLTVIQGDLQEVLPELDRLHLQDFDVIISRGGTATLLSKHTRLPVIDIQVSGFDILRMLTMVRDFQAPVEVIGFRNVIEGIISVSILMETEVTYTIIHHEGEVDHALHTAKAKGVKMIVGDNITVKKAADYGLQGVLITSGRESLMMAFTQAKQIYKITATHKVQHQAFSALLDTVESGCAIVDQEGLIQYANPSFREQLRIEASQSNLFQGYPLYQTLLNCIDKGLKLNQHLLMVDQEGQLGLTADAILTVSDTKMYVVKVIQAMQADADIHVVCSSGMNASFPPFIMTQTVSAKGKASSTLPMAVYGKEGVGKRLYVLGSLSERAKSMVEIRIFRTTGVSIKALQAFISLIDEDQLIYISGIERLSLILQQELSLALDQVAHRTVFSFLEDPAILAEQARIDKKLYNLFRKQMVYIAPLSERRADLEEYIRAFLISLNEKYGKQIVGIRPEVAEALYQHTWEGNLFELRSVMEQFVQHTTGEYIDTNVLPILHKLRDQTLQVDPSNLIALNIHRPLDEIEKDIIQIVLEQEGMNQSQAANRLGISRSTMWRKLKG